MSTSLRGASAGVGRAVRSRTFTGRGGRGGSGALICRAGGAAFCLGRAFQYVGERGYGGVGLYEALLTDRFSVLNVLFAAFWLWAAV